MANLEHQTARRVHSTVRGRTSDSTSRPRVLHSYLLSRVIRGNAASFRGTTSAPSIQPVLAFDAIQQQAHSTAPSIATCRHARPEAAPPRFESPFPTLPRSASTTSRVYAAHLSSPCCDSRPMHGTPRPGTPYQPTPARTLKPCCAIEASTHLSFSRCSVLSVE